MEQMKFCISIKRSLYELIRERANERDMSIACYIRQAVIEYMNNHKE